MIRGITPNWGFWELFVPQAMRGFAILLCIVPSVGMALNGVPPEELRYASGLFNLMRNLGGAIGIAVVTTLAAGFQPLARRTLRREPVRRGRRGLVARHRPPRPIRRRHQPRETDARRRTHSIRDARGADLGVRGRLQTDGRAVPAGACDRAVLQDGDIERRSAADGVSRTTAFLRLSILQTQLAIDEFAPNCIMKLMPAPYKTAAVANWFLERAKRDGVRLDPMKLQKLIYFAHGWYLALADRPLIDEHIQAWDYGPVVPSIYHEFKRFGPKSIESLATVVEYPEISTGDKLQDLYNVTFATPVVMDDPEVQDFLERIWSVYGKLSAIQLSNMSHVEGGAWDNAFQRANGKRSIDISDDLIKREFDAKRIRNRAAAAH